MNNWWDRSRDGPSVLKRRPLFSLYTSYKIRLADFVINLANTLMHLRVVYDSLLYRREREQDPGFRHIALFAVLFSPFLPRRRIFQAEERKVRTDEKETLSGSEHRPVPVPDPVRLRRKLRKLLWRNSLYHRSRDHRSFHHRNHRRRHRDHRQLPSAWARPPAASISRT